MAAVDIIITGVLLGGMFALVSVGFSLQYGVGRVLNVSHGEFIMVGAFVTFWLFSSHSVNPLLSIVVTAPLTVRDRVGAARDPVPATHGQGSFARHVRGPVDARVVRAALYRAEHRQDHLGLSDLQHHLSADDRRRSAADPAQPPRGLWGDRGDRRCILYLFLAHTRLGKAIRASGQDPTTAGLMGVNIHTVLAICFGIGSGHWPVSPGRLMSTVLAISTSMGLQYTVIAMIVVVLGGLGQHHGGGDRRRDPGDRVPVGHVLLSDHEPSSPTTSSSSSCCSRGLKGSWVSDYEQHHIHTDRRSLGRLQQKQDHLSGDPGGHLRRAGAASRLHAGKLLDHQDLRVHAVQHPRYRLGALLRTHRLHVAGHRRLLRTWVSIWRPSSTARCRSRWSSSCRASRPSSSPAAIGALTLRLRGVYFCIFTFAVVLLLQQRRSRGGAPGHRHARPLRAAGVGPTSRTTPYSSSSC